MRRGRRSRLHIRLGFPILSQRRRGSRLPCTPIQSRKAHAQGRFSTRLCPGKCSAPKSSFYTPGFSGTWTALHYLGRSIMRHLWQNGSNPLTAGNGWRAWNDSLDYHGIERIGAQGTSAVPLGEENIYRQLADNPRWAYRFPTGL